MPAHRAGVARRNYRPCLSRRRRSPFPVRPPVLPRRATLARAHLPALSSRYDDTSLPPRRGAQVHAHLPHSLSSCSSSARIAARSRRTPCLHVPAGDAIIRPALPACACSPCQKLQPHQAVSRLLPHLLSSDAGGPRSGE